MIRPCFRSAPFIHTDLPMATASPHKHIAAMAARIVAAAMGGTPALLNLIATMFPPQMRQTNTRRTAPLTGICLDVVELNNHSTGKEDRDGGPPDSVLGMGEESMGDKVSPITPYTSPFTSA